MKRITVMLFLLGASSQVFGQAFKKGDFHLTAGFGLGAGTARTNYTSEAFYDPYYEVYGTGSYYTSSGTGAVIFPFTLEYALSNRFGIGLAFQQGSYLNSIRASKGEALSFGLSGAFHFLDHDKTDLYVRLIAGFCTIDLRENYRKDSYYGSSIPSADGSFLYRLQGGFGKLSFGLRRYFSEHLGAFIDAGIGIYSCSGNQVETDLGTFDLEVDKRQERYNTEITTGLSFRF